GQGLLARLPVDALGVHEGVEVRADLVADQEPARVEVAAVQEYGVPPALRVITEATHHLGPAVDVGPTTGVPDRQLVFRTHDIEQLPQVDLLDHHLDVDLLVVPELAGFVPPPAVNRPPDPLGHVLLGVAVGCSQVQWRTGLVAGDDVQGQEAGFAAV